MLFFFLMRLVYFLLSMSVEPSKVKFDIKLNMFNLLVFLTLDRFKLKSEVSRTPTDDFGDRHTSQLILHSFFLRLHNKPIFLRLLRTQSAEHILLQEERVFKELTSYWDRTNKLLLRRQSLYQFS